MVLHKFAIEFLLKCLLIPVSFVDDLIDRLLFSKYKIEKNRIFAKLSNPNDSNSPYKSCENPDTLRVDDPNDNIFNEFEKSVQKFSNLDLLGTREIYSIENETQTNGKILVKYNLGEYKWQVYKDVYKRVIDFSNGLLSIGLESKANLVIFSETRAEWIMCALACFRINVPVVTLYATLGIEAVKYGILQTETKYLVISKDQLSKLEEIIDKLPHIEYVIVIDSICSYDIDRLKAKSKVNILFFEDVESKGSKLEASFKSFIKPKRDDIAIIMYTSGSTGAPKGAMITHGNMICSMKTYPNCIGKVRPGVDIYIGYLPLAHILELACELSCLVAGLRLGYSSPQTITDSSTGIKKGQRGDVIILKPTVMVSVPMVVERVYKAMKDKIAQKSYFAQTLFQLAYNQKLKAFQNGQKTLLLDRLIFRKISTAVLGGQIKYMFCGGALLNKDVQEFIQVCIAPVRQAYALTETSAGGTAQYIYETATEECGSLMPYCQMRLVDWEEGGYHCTDKPNPRGEIHLGGDSISMGYYKMPEKTKEDFYSYNGMRYFATGDIGEVLPNGNLKIIDRKKDLVKLQGGEYVSLNKIETCIKLLPFVDNCCVYANPLYSYCICFVCPNIQKLQDLGNGLGLSDLTLKTIANHEQLTQKLTQIITNHCLKDGINKMEIPAKIKLVEEIWLPDTGLVTDSLKLKRKAIETYYAKDIERLYKKS